MPLLGDFGINSSILGTYLEGKHNCIDIVDFKVYPNYLDR
jgi:hypothetical protein